MTPTSYSHDSVQSKRVINKRQEELLREFDAELEKSSRGISGRVADAAEDKKMDDKKEEKKAQ